MGRDRKNEARVEHYTKMTRKMMETEAWRALGPNAQALYPWLRLEWRGIDYNNNGKIRLSVRQAAACLGISINTANRAFHSLQAKGFIVVRKMAALGVEGHGRSTEYELTELPMPPERAGKETYGQWTPESDFEVLKAPTNRRAGK